jgi:quercetin dioxygenase-like cupin family protein
MSYQICASVFATKDKASMTELIARDRFQTPVSREAVAADWRARGFSCELFIDPPGREWNDFVHRTDELVTVVEGRLEITIGDNCITAKPGDEVFIPVGAVHSVKNIHSATTRWLYGYG